MKAIVIFLFVVFLIPFTTSANVKNKQNDLRNYKTELNLTSQQLSQLDAIYSSFEAKTKLQAPASKEENIKLRHERRKEFRMEVANVLTEEQKVKLKEMIQTKRANK